MGWAFGLLAALAFGCGDFLGGLSARRSTWWQVAFVAQASGLVPLAWAVLHAGGAINQAGLCWSFVAGAGEATGICLLYKALADGQMAIIAPVTALLAIALPVLLQVLTGTQPSSIALAGIAAAGTALFLISREPSDGAKAKVTKAALFTAMAAGLGVALFMIGLSQAQSGTRALADGAWPALIARATCTALTGVAIALAAGTQGTFRTMPGWALAGATIAGVFDAVATLALMSSMRFGSLASAATLTSLYPAVTIMLAMLVLRERLTLAQRCGLVLAGVAAIAITQNS